MTSQDDVSAIGTTAGVVWKELHQNGPMTVAALKKVQNLSESEVQRAIGWLARDEKIRFEKQGKGVLIALK